MRYIRIHKCVQIDGIYILFHDQAVHKKRYKKDKKSYLSDVLAMKAFISIARWMSFVEWGDKVCLLFNEQKWKKKQYIYFAQRAGTKREGIFNIWRIETNLPIWIIG